MKLREYIETRHIPMHVARKRPLTQREILRTIHKYILPLFGDRELDSFTRKDWRDYAHHLQFVQKLSAKSTKNYQSVLRKIMTEAVEDGYIDDFISIRGARPELPDIPYLNASQQSSIEWAASVEKEKRWHAMVQVALNTGMRIGELRALRWPDIVSERDGLYLYVAHSVSGRENEIGPTKNGKPRKIACNETVRAFLQNLRAFTGSCKFIFGNPLQPLAPITYKACDVAIKRIRERTDVEICGWHTFRHTVATILANKPNITLPQVQQLLGHMDIGTTMRYVHVDPSSLIATTAALDETKLGLVNNHF